jgi:hypothetical protein
MEQRTSIMTAPRMAVLGANLTKEAYTMQLFQASNQTDKNSGIGATLRTGKRTVTMDKRTGQKIFGPVEWGASQEAPLKTISRERFLEGSSLAKKPTPPEVGFSIRSQLVRRPRNAKRRAAFAGYSRPKP